MKRLILLLLVPLLLASCSRTVTVSEIEIVPEPVFMLKKEGSFTLNRSIAVATYGLGQNSPTAKYIMNSLRHAHMRPSLVSRSEESDIELIINDTVNPELGSEGYLLEVRPSGIRLSANTEAGLFYAYQTFIQILPADALDHTYSSIVLPECTILDYPRFEWRGVFLDLRRQVFSVKSIKKILDLMATYKMNRLFWMPADTAAASDTSLLSDSIAQEEEESTDIHYSDEEIADVIAYANSLGIIVMPDDSTLVAWDSTTAAPTLPLSTIAACTSLQAGLKAARTGNNVVMCPDEYCRMDFYQADRRYQPLAASGLITLAKAYQFDPAPHGTNKYIEEKIIGGQLSLWSEFISSPSQAEYMLLPRMLAISESLWSPRESKSWSRFRKKMEMQKERLASKGYNYCEGSFTPLFRATRINENTTNIAIETEVPSTYIFYTTDGSTPSRQSQVYIGPINLKKGTHIKILPVYKDHERDSVYEFIIK